MLAPMFRRLPTEAETMDALAMIEHAIAEKLIMEVTFFKEMPGRPWFSDRFDAVFGRRRMLTGSLVRRTVEPRRWDTNADGEPYMDVISLSSPGEEYPAPRRIRVDRIAVVGGRLRLRVTRRRFLATGTGLDPARIAASV